MPPSGPSVPIPVCGRSPSSTGRLGARDLGSWTDTSNDTEIDTSHKQIPEKLFITGGYAHRATCSQHRGLPLRHETKLNPQPTPAYLREWGSKRHHSLASPKG